MGVGGWEGGEEEVLQGGREGGSTGGCYRKCCRDVVVLGEGREDHTSRPEDLEINVPVYCSYKHTNIFILLGLRTNIIGSEEDWCLIIMV